MPETIIPSEITGTVWKIEVQAGARVTQDQTLVVMESMKMEIPLSGPCDGVVLRILVAEGEPVVEGQDVVVLE